MNKITPTAKPPVDIPPPWDRMEQHGVLPRANHDEIARFNFLANLNKHLAQSLGPGNKLAYETRVAPALEAELGRPPESRHEIRKAMNRDPYHRFWSALKRSAMEQRQQAGLSLVLRQIDEIMERVQKADGNLTLDPEIEVPRYVAGVDNHCMPGSYHSERFPGDVTAGANYDVGLFVTTGGALGRRNDGGGQAVAEWIGGQHSDFRPKRILDVGCTVGHNTLPLAQAYPEAEVIAIDVGTPVLRYAAARAHEMGIDNVHFLQADAADLSRFEDESFDWVQTTMFLHETSNRSMRHMFNEFYRVMAPGALMLHLEQPQYGPDMPLYEQFIRDWDAFNNNEPFWSKMHELDLREMLRDAGFGDNEIFETHVHAVIDPDLFPEAQKAQQEDHGRAAAWHVFGAWKGGSPDGG